MLTIIDKIKLKDASHEDDFVKWVKEVDYLACRELPSVETFCVHKVMREGDCDFIEIITVTSLADFEKDMRSAPFAALVERFTQMADVSEQLICDPIPPGYRR
ncbi:RedY protein [Chitinimonas arctica]|uniref:RedY protein n=1 Tax=Chitinimonas arctica TaxID=2594795 RepID=A0A516SCT2_9NEIS|nr:RedY protein [Chitinimonas arctica]QDQ25954.1 RedY protein [Chitinimonas arctica]